MNDKNTLRVVVIGLIAVIVLLVLLSGLKNKKTADLEQACINSGGEVRTGLCCKSVGDFPDICAIGACGCAPDHSHEVKICDCGNKCFDGSSCV